MPQALRRFFCERLLIVGVIRSDRCKKNSAQQEEECFVEQCELTEYEA